MPVRADEADPRLARELGKTRGVTEVETTYLVLGTTVLLLALTSRVLKSRLWLSEPLVALAIGVAVGPRGLGWLKPATLESGTATLEVVSRLTVAISVMGVALRLPRGYLRRCARPLLVLLLICMPGTWLLSALLGGLVLGLSASSALLLGAVLTPTDPVLADAIVTGDLAERNVVARVRNLISAEAGANDGLAFLLVMAPILATQYSGPEAISRWLSDVLLHDVVLALAIGAAAGWCTGWLMRWGLRGEGMAPTPLLSVTVALSVALLGGVRELDSDGILAVFAAGVALNAATHPDHHERRQEVQEAITRFFDQPVFLLLGIVLPWDAFYERGWRLLAYAVLIVLLRRLPLVLLLRPWLAPAIRGWREAFFAGWFGPIGAAALVYASWIKVDQGAREIWIVGSFVVLSSLVVHGVSATPLTRLHGRATGRASSRSDGRHSGASG